MMQKRILLFLRFFLILSTILVMTYSQRGLRFPEPGYIVALAYFLSNLLLYRVSEKYFSKALVSFFIFLFDIAAISLAVYFAQGFETDFYLIYLLAIFIASVNQDIAGSLPIAIVASVFYGWMVYRSSPGVSLLDSKILMRVPFLFTLSLISTYWARSMRTELKKKDELEKFNIELRQTVDKVTTEEKKMRLYTEKVINSVPSGVIATRGSSIITTLNPEAERILGLRPEDVLGADIKNITQLRPLWQKMSETMNTRTALIRDEVTIKNAKDEVIPIGMSISPIADEDERFSGSVVIFVDLSEKRELQEKLKHAERLSYLGKMASWVAHEIRNPLTAIDGFAKLLINNKKKEKAQMYCTEIKKGTTRINHIIDDILAFARTERKITPVDIDLRELIGSITGSITGTQVIINGVQSAMARGDYESIRRVFINLINNAIEAMDKHRELRINFSSKGDMTITDIADIGKGIPEEDMKNLFTPFFSTKPRGTGLGLPIVKKIVEEHNGAIDIKSQIGVGTTCRVYLPKEDRRDDG